MNRLLKARILVVDDSPSMLTFVETILHAAGHTVLTASSGSEAMVVLKREPFDLVITDIIMPPPDGLEVLRQARSLKLTVPFIAISSQPPPLNKFIPARGLGARLALRKPFSGGQLIGAVDAVLDCSRGAPWPATGDKIIAPRSA